jgi:Raf kinase inhibitor-like YbhB/YbcL family protein
MLCMRVRVAACALGVLVLTLAATAQLKPGPKFNTEYDAKSAGGQNSPNKTPMVRGGRMAFTLSSGAFQNGEAFPRDFTCDGSDASPALSWTGAPDGTKAFALIVDDPDAPGGVFTHWIIYDIPGDATSLPQGMPKTEIASGARQGRNSFGKIGYGGPCPPPGKPHRYFFRLHALSKPLGLKSGATKQDVERAISGSVLGTAELMGKYGRTKS